MAGKRYGFFRRLGGAVVALLLLVAVPVMTYLAAGVAGSLIPAAGSAPRPSEGIRIFVADNGVHTDLVLPAADWHDLLPSVTQPYSHVMFGWGDRDFYLNTPSWSDIDPVTVARAAVGSDTTVVHVQAIDNPQPGKNMRAVILRPEEYARLGAHVRASMAGQQPIRGYGASDVFYSGTGTYSAIASCNEWTGRALRQANVRMGAWTPLPFGVMRWL
jgi:uncharacterized protein (TIGR02117 family)